MGINNRKGSTVAAGDVASIAGVESAAWALGLDPVVLI